MPSFANVPAAAGEEYRPLAAGDTQTEAPASPADAAPPLAKNTSSRSNKLMRAPGPSDVVDAGSSSCAKVQVQIRTIGDLDLANNTFFSLFELNVEVELGADMDEWLNQPLAGKANLKPFKDGGYENTRSGWLQFALDAQRGQLGFSGHKIVHETRKQNLGCVSVSLLNSREASSTSTSNLPLLVIRCL